MADFGPEGQDDVYIGDGVKLTGVLNAQGTVTIDGAFDGEITCKHLIVGASGGVSGRADVFDADVHGNVSARLVAKQLLTVRASARVEGNWVCHEIIAERGAVLNGTAGEHEPRSIHKTVTTISSQPSRVTSIPSNSAAASAVIAPKPVARGPAAMRYSLGRK